MGSTAAQGKACAFQVQSSNWASCWNWQGPVRCKRCRYWCSRAERRWLGRWKWDAVEIKGLEKGGNKSRVLARGQQVQAPKVQEQQAQEV